MKTLNMVTPWDNKELWSVFVEAVAMGLHYDQTREIIQERFEDYDISFDQYNAMELLFGASFHLDSAPCVIDLEGKVVPTDKYVVDFKYEAEHSYQSIRIFVEVPNRQDAYAAALTRLPYSWKCHIDDIVVTNVEKVVDIDPPF